MKRRIFYLTVLLIILLGTEAPCQSFPAWRNGDFTDTDPELERLNKAFVRFAGRVRPAVVHVRIHPNSSQAASSRGSGFIFNPDGYILTAHHVVDGAKEIEVRLADGQRLPGQVIAMDPQVDFAIVKINGAGNFPILSFGDSDNLKVGELAGSLGFPFGTESSLHVGIISRSGKRQNGSAAFRLCANRHRG